MRKVFTKIFFVNILLFGVSYFAARAEYTLQTPLPVQAAGEGLVGYINSLYVLALGLSGVTALGVITYGGILYISSAGNSSIQGDAKDRIYKALIGLGLLVGSFLILYTINPDLVNLTDPKFTVEIKQVGTAKTSCEGDNECLTGYSCIGYIENSTPGICNLKTGKETGNETQPKTLIEKQ